MGTAATFVDRVHRARLVTDSVLHWATQESATTGRPLEEVLVEKAPAVEHDLYRILADYLGLPFEDLRQRERSAELARLLPGRVAFACKVAPLEAHDHSLTVAIGSPDTLARLDEVASVSGRSVAPVLCPPGPLDRFIRDLYGLGAETVEQLTAPGATDGSGASGSPGADAPIIRVLSAQTHEIDSQLDSVQQASITHFVDQMLVQAIRDRASDIHIEPYERHLLIRFRCDGELREVPVPPNIKQLEPAIVSRIKVLANLDIAEKRLSQDGQMRLGVFDRTVDVRVSVLPTIHGESLVLRLLNPQVQVTSIRDIGMPADMLERYTGVLEMAQGLILVTGPTGSGKTTTLYTSLNHINRPRRKIITIEDPVEYRLEGISQVQVKESIGLTFNTVLRNIVRHDPDVLMVGEIRDNQTAQIALNSAITGHLVMSTLHTNDAPTAVARLLNMGVPGYMIAAALKVVVAQRLVRVICPQCREEAQDVPEFLRREFPELEGRPVYRGAGCESCRHTGYLGRSGIYEFFVVAGPMSDMIVSGASAGTLRAAAIEGGMTPLRQAGLNRILAGETTMDEVYRVTRDVQADGTAAPRPAAPPVKATT